MRPIAAYGVRRTVLRHLAAAAPETVTGGDLRIAIRSTDRHALEGVLAELLGNGLIVQLPARCGGRRLALAPQPARKADQHRMIGDSQ
ncbi:hypothetical protein [Mycolicibacterium sp. A43C]